MSDPPFLIRLASPDDDDFIIGLVPRFVDFPLPSWRRRNECIEGIRRDLSNAPGGLAGQQLHVRRRGSRRRPPPGLRAPAEGAGLLQRTHQLPHLRPGRGAGPGGARHRPRTARAQPRMGPRASLPHASRWRSSPATSGPAGCTRPPASTSTWCAWPCRCPETSIGRAANENARPSRTGVFHWQCATRRAQASLPAVASLPCLGQLPSILASNCGPLFRRETVVHALRSGDPGWTARTGGRRSRPGCRPASGRATWSASSARSFSSSTTNRPLMTVSLPGMRTSMLRVTSRSSSRSLFMNSRVRRDVLLELAQEPHGLLEHLGFRAVLVEQALAFLGAEALIGLVQEHGEIVAAWHRLPAAARPARTDSGARRPGCSRRPPNGHPRRPSGSRSGACPAGRSDRDRRCLLPANRIGKCAPP